MWSGNQAQYTPSTNCVSTLLTSVFVHIDVEDLEAVLRKAIIEGRPKTHKPWTKIMIIVEGVYR